MGNPPDITPGDPASGGPSQVEAPSGWSKLRRNRVAWISLWFLGALLVFVFAAPWFLPRDLIEPGEAIYGAPSGKYLCGTDQNGRDLFYRVIQGGQVSLIVGLAGAAVSLFIGTVYGLVAGYLGGRVDAVMMRIVDVLYSIPRILFVLILINVLDDPLRDLLSLWKSGLERGGFLWLADWITRFIPYTRIFILIVSLGLIEWLTMARIVRGQVLALKEHQFILAARGLGQKTSRIMRLHLLPNLWTVILTCMTLTIPTVILAESFLSFLGLGIDEPQASWGSLLKEGAEAINPIKSYWWLLVFPASLMSLTLLALNFVGDGLRDAFDPRAGN